MKRQVFPLLLLAALLGCKPSTPPAVPTNRLDFYLRFVQPESQVKAEATLTIIEPTSAPHEAEIPGLQFNGSAMHASAAHGMTYTLETQSGGIPATIFSWKNKAGVGLTFEPSFGVIEDFYFEPKPISTSKSARLTWTGQPLGQDEALLLLFQNGDSQSVTLQVAGATNVPSVDFPAAEIGKLSPGDWTVYIVRKKVAKQKLDEFELRSLAEYYSKEVPVKVIR